MTKRIAKTGKAQSGATPINARSLLPSDRKSKQLLKQRAQALAERQQRQQASVTEQYLHFRLGPREWYGIPYQWLVELLYAQGIVRVPGTPAFIAGVMNHRGELLTVLDLHQFFHTRDGCDGDQTRVLVVSDGKLKLGLMVDEVAGNEHYDPAGLAPPMASEGVAKIEYVAGIHRGEVTMLDLQALLADPAILVDDSSS